MKIAILKIERLARKRVVDAGLHPLAIDQVIAKTLNFAVMRVNRKSADRPLRTPA